MRTRKIFRKAENKLKNTCGESIAEVLVALLISSVALVMLASMISTTSNIITTTKKTIKNYYEHNNAIIAFDEAKAPDKTDKTFFSSESANASKYTVDILKESGSGNTSILNNPVQITVYENKVLSTTVVNYKINTTP